MKTIFGRLYAHAHILGVSVFLWLFHTGAHAAGTDGGDGCIGSDGSILSDQTVDGKKITCDTLFGNQLNAIIDTLTGPFAAVIALVAFIAAGSVLIFQNRELNDFIKTLLNIVLVACLLFLAGQIIYFFFGGGGGAVVHLS